MNGIVCVVVDRSDLAVLCHRRRLDIIGYESEARGKEWGMKAISLWQPYASLIALNIKRFETRHWSTSYRGEIAIHAAKRWTGEEEHYWNYFTEHFDCPLPFDAPLGAMLCICKLTHVGRTEEVVTRISNMEREMGNFSPGRFAWRMEVLEVFPTPIPTRGQQGIFDWIRPAASDGEK